MMIVTGGAGFKCRHRVVLFGLCAVKLAESGNKNRSRWERHAIVRKRSNPTYDSGALLERIKIYSGVIFEIC